MKLLSESCGGDNPDRRICWVANNFKVECEEEFLSQQAILDETCRIESLDDLQQNVDVFLPLYKLPLDEINDLEKCRVAIYETASDPIRYEQVKQKMQYDKKVNTRRYVDHFCLFIIRLQRSLGVHKLIV